MTEPEPLSQMTAPITGLDSHYLNAAAGWIELGNFHEANEELERIAPTLRAHPIVLALRWTIYANAKKWEACRDIAEAITKIAPDIPGGWIKLAKSFYLLNDPDGAYCTLSSVAARFSGEWSVSYNLACYAVQLGKLNEAETLIHRAINSGDKNHIQHLLMEDPDLEPLRAKFGLQTKRDGK